ncbi:Major Facilitator Superfamily [Phytophthora cinnamomi]|uniref:Major Facilitator Superfamily n=1 Tax=Phytophthora cinnamomi TaxID=4785 RepID=UPI00355A6420|nr:Major Facilitator Superfamily [Phytophthora cinnamomi]
MQPIVLELGVECAYPTSEATVAALQQLCGNFFSALVVPGLSALQRTNFAATDGLPPRHFYASPEWIMVFMTAVTFFLFCSFVSTSRRRSCCLIITPKTNRGLLPRRKDR